MISGNTLSDDFDDGNLDGWTTDSAEKGSVTNPGTEMRVHDYKCHWAKARRNLGNQRGQVTFSFDWRTETDYWYERPRFAVYVDDVETYLYEIPRGKATTKSGSTTKSLDVSGTVEVEFRVDPSGPCGSGDHGKTDLFIDNFTFSWPVVDDSIGPYQQARTVGTPHAYATTTTATHTDQPTISSPNVEATTTPDRYTSAKLTSKPSSEATATSEQQIGNPIRDVVSVLDLVRLMPIASVDSKPRTLGVHQQQVFNGAIEHNDAARREAFDIERTVFPGSARRVPSSPDIRLRKFETVTTGAHRQTTLPASLVELARLTTGTHMAAHLSPKIGALVAMDARYPLSRTDITTAAFEPMDSTYLAALEQPVSTAVSTLTNDTYRSVAPVVELFAPYWPIGNSVYSLTTPDSTTMTATDVGKTMTGAKAQAAVDGRPTKRATVRRLREAGVPPLALVLDARTPYPMVLVAADIFGEESGGTTLRPHDAGLGGLDTTEDVIFGSRTNGFSMQ